MIEQINFNTLLNMIILIVIGFLLYFKFSKQDIKKEKIQNLEKEMQKIKKEFKEEFKLQEINTIILKQEIYILKKKNYLFLNSYKLLYFRKISNIILENILTKYSTFFYKTIFIDNSKPEGKKIKFPLIIAKEKIANIEVNTINLLIDFFMYIKNFTSSFIHLAEQYPIQIEILFDLFGEEKIERQQDYYYVESFLLIDAIFGKKSQENVSMQNIDNNKELIINEIKEDISKLQNSVILKDISNEIIEKNEGKSSSNNSSETGTSIKEENINCNNLNKKEDEKNQIIDGIKIQGLKKNNIQKENSNNKKENTSFKDELITRIDDIIDLLKNQYYGKNNNYPIFDIINKIKELNIEDILKSGIKFNKDELFKLNCIKEFNNIILKNKNSLKDIAIIDGEFIFKKWKNSFEENNYKSSEQYKNLVIYDKNIKFKTIENATKNLMGSSMIKIFCEDPGNFPNKLKDILKEDNFKKYNIKLKKK